MTSHKHNRMKKLTHPHTMGAMCLVWAVIIYTASAQKIYNIENMCNMAGSYDVESDITVYFRGGYDGAISISDNICRVKLRASNGDHILSFDNFYIALTCGVALDIKYGGTQKSYECGTLSPGKFSSETRDVEVVMTRPVNSGTSFGKFQFTITAGIKPIDPALGSSSAVSVTLIVGSVVGVCVFLLLICIIGVCMHKKIRRAKMNEMYYASQSAQVQPDTGPNKSVAFTNSDYSSNADSSPLAKTKLLKGFGENINESPNSGRRANRPETLNIRNGYKPNPDSDERKANDVNYSENPNEVYYNLDESKIEQPNRPQTPVTPILSALQTNAKFRKSFSENERDADERAKRISYSTSNDSLQNERPQLPKVPEPSKRPVNLKKNQSMRKATRPDSYLDYSSSTQGSEEMEDEGNRNREVVEKPKHTLRPNRKKSPEQDRRLANKPPRDPRLDDLRDDEEERVGLFVKQGSTRSSARSSKRSQKSPRLGKGSKGFGHRRSNSRGDDAISIGSRTDLESLPPLQRSGSKSSLYASRSSLYSRRRGRDRADSCGESIVSYAHDDIDYYRRSRRSERDFDDYEEDFGGYEKPISRNDRLRMSKSDHDLGRAMKEISTQTLRETATQTGHEQAVTVHTKRVVKKRPRSRSLSAMGTQTQKRERSKSRTKSKENVAATSDEETDVKEVKPPPKPKPKPKPRKSLTENAVQSDNEGLKKKKRQRSKSDANLRSTKSTEDLNVDSKAVPGPQVPHHMHPSQTVPANMQNYAPNGMFPVPPPYTTLPHGAQPHMQYAPNQQPVMFQSQPYPQATQPIAVPQPQRPPVAAKPRNKSNWEMLMEITDKQKMGVPTDTESVVSSVFTSNPPPTYQPGQPGIYPYQQGYSQYTMQPGQQFQQPGQQFQQPVQQFQQPVQVGQQFQQPIQPSIQQGQMQPVKQPYQQQVQPQLQMAQPQSGRYPSTQGWTQQSGTSDSASSSGMSGSGSSTSGMYVAQSQGLSSQGKSSWDRLKELTDQQSQAAPSVKGDKANESIV